MDIEKGVVLVNIDDILPNRFQPRLAFDENELKSLSESIKQHGVIQPLVLRQLGDKYEIIAGERRYKASTLAGLKEVPAVIMNVDDSKSAEIAVVENIQRKNLTAIEEAQSYKKLLDKGMTQEELSTKLGISQPTIANKIRLLALDEEVQQSLLTNQISERHARSLLRIADKNKQIELLHRIINERLTVKQADIEIGKLLGNNIPEQKEESIPKISSTEEKDNVFNLDVNEIKNESKDLFESEKKVSFEDLMKKQELVIPEASIIEESLRDETPEILDFDILDEKGESKEEPLSENPIINEYKKQEYQEVSSGNITDAISSARGLKDSLISKGFKVNTEEFDFEDMYQIVIKIQKD